MVTMIMMILVVMIMKMMRMMRKRMTMIMNSYTGRNMKIISMHLQVPTRDGISATWLN